MGGNLTLCLRRPLRKTSVSPARNTTCPYRKHKNGEEMNPTCYCGFGATWDATSTAHPASASDVSAFATT
eukprot:4193775-Prymnesium_polylepis.1